MNQTKPGSFFPPYLNAGNGAERSSGGPVAMLQTWLVVIIFPQLDQLPNGGALKGNPLQVTGIYDEPTELWVQTLQRHLLGFQGLDVDGFFGPSTRQAFAKVFGLNADAIPEEMMRQPTLWAEPRVDMKKWPPEPEPPQA